VSDGFLVEDGPKIGKSRPAQLAPNIGTLVGIDVTLDNVMVAVSDASFGLLNDPATTLTAIPIKEARTSLELIAELVAQVLDTLGSASESVIGLGLGLPGPIDRESGIPTSPSILPGWAGMDVPTELQAMLAQIHGYDIRCVVGNNASLGGLGVFTRAVFHDPVGAPRDLIYLRVTHGIGAGLIVKGHLVTGAVDLPERSATYASAPAGRSAHVAEPEVALRQSLRRSPLRRRSAPAPPSGTPRRKPSKTFSSRNIQRDSRPSGKRGGMSAWPSLRPPTC
jgi:ROK family